MRKFLVSLMVLSFSVSVKATDWSYMPSALVLIQEELNKDVYSFDHKIISFSLSRNQQVARLSIKNNICPAVSGLTCMAMPATVLNATYTLKLVETDGCNVRTFISNRIEVASRTDDSRRFTQIKVKDTTQATCKMKYFSDVEVQLKDTTVLGQDLTLPENKYSFLHFDYIQN
jgi:hypothetical protein